MKVFPSRKFRVGVMKTRKFWFDEDPEGEIYENLAWDLPGFRRHGSKPRSSDKPKTPRSKS